MQESIDKNWYALYTKARHEFKVRNRLDLMNIETFLPTVERTQRWSDRKKKVTFPLFSCYLFVRTSITYEDKVKILRTPGVVKFVSLKNGAPEPIPDEQILNLKKAIESKEQIDLYPYLKEGLRVRVKKGPLEEGVIGVLIEKREGYLLVLSVDVIQQGAALKIDASFVEAV
ncbi:UpxY family transcription antiterminator [Thermodesulfovibrio hydrogeniphilus]